MGVLDSENFFSFFPMINCVVIDFLHVYLVKLRNQVSPYGRSDCKSNVTYLPWFAYKKTVTTQFIIGKNYEKISKSKTPNYTIFHWKNLSPLNCIKKLPTTQFFIGKNYEKKSKSKTPLPHNFSLEIFKNTSKIEIDFDIITFLKS